MNKKILFILLILSSLPLVSAQSWNSYGYGYLSPQDLLNNEWVVFGLIFAVFFAVIFFALGKTFRDNLGVAAIVSLALSFFISAIISQRVSFYGYIGEDVGGWIFLFAILIIIAFALKALLDLGGAIGLALGLVGSWFFIRYIDWETLLPYSVATNEIFLFVQQWFIGLIVIIIAIFILSKRKEINDATRKKTQWERMMMGKS